MTDKHWSGVNNDETIARLMQKLADKGVEQFGTDLAIELQVNHS